MINEIFGKLVVVEEAGTNNHRKKLWLCRCECGGETKATTGNLRSGNTRSCGCEKREAGGRARRTHGQSGQKGKRTRAYSTWSNMMTRCYNKTNEKYPRWGGRGITVCQKWHTFEGFYEDMGDPPEDLTLHREDNDGNYCKENCIWATDDIQAQVRRMENIATFVTVNGVTKSLTGWAKELGMHSDAVATRIRNGWEPERACTTPRTGYGPKGKGGV
jgi:hypothetical protein